MFPLLLAAAPAILSMVSGLFGGGGQAAPAAQASQAQATQAAQAAAAGAATGAAAAQARASTPARTGRRYQSSSYIDIPVATSPSGAEIPATEHVAAVGRGIVRATAAHSDPALQEILGLLRQRSTQIQATSEHRRIQSRQQFRRGLLARLDRIERDMRSHVVAPTPTRPRIEFY